MNHYKIKSLDDDEEKEIDAVDAKDAWKYAREVLLFVFFTIEQVEENRYNQNRYGEL